MIISTIVIMVIVAITFVDILDYGTELWFRYVMLHVVTPTCQRQQNKNYNIIMINSFIFFISVKCIVWILIIAYNFYVWIN